MCHGGELCANCTMKTVLKLHINPAKRVLTLQIYLTNQIATVPSKATILYRCSFMETYGNICCTVTISRLTPFRLFETSMFHKRRKEANRTSRPSPITTAKPKPLFQTFVEIFSNKRPLHHQAVFTTVTTTAVTSASTTTTTSTASTTASTTSTTTQSLMENLGCIHHSDLNWNHNLFQNS